MDDKIKQKLQKEIISMEEAKSLRDSCYDYFYKKFGDNWEKEFYKKHLKNLKSNCDYLDLKLKLKQHYETSNDFKKRLKSFKEKIKHCGNLLIQYNIETDTMQRNDSNAVIVLEYLTEIFPEIKILEK